MFKNYIKVAFRNILRYKGFSLINIAGLTVGMACFILIFIWVYDELHYDTYHARSDRLCRIILKQADNPGDSGIPSTPYILPQILKEELEMVNRNAPPMVNRNTLVMVSRNAPLAVNRSAPLREEGVPF
jgi:hypothetical protein